jgi:hypothetical protein
MKSLWQHEEHQAWFENIWFTLPAGSLYFQDADLCVDFRTGCQYACYELGGLCAMTGIPKPLSEVKSILAVSTLLLVSPTTLAAIIASELCCSLTAIAQ